MSGHPFFSDPELQGRVTPPDAPAAEGDASLCLGSAVPGVFAVLGSTNAVITQRGNSGASKMVRAVVRVGHYNDATPGSWVLQGILSQGAGIGTRFQVTVERARTLTDFAMITGDLVGDFWAGFRLTYNPSAPPEEVELPVVFVDSFALAETGGITLGNRVPCPAETDVPADSLIDLEIMAPAGPTPLTSATSVYVNDVLAYTNGVFQAGFNGASSATYTTSSGRALHVRIDKTVPFASQEVVTVRVVSNVTGLVLPLDASYSFTVVDTTAPTLLQATGTGLKTVNALFNEAMTAVDPTALGDALRPGNYTLTAQTAPAVSASVVSCAVSASSEIALTTDIELTPGAVYLLEVANVTDAHGNTITPPLNQVTFTAWSPPIPAGRTLDVYRLLPWINREEDTTQDLLKFCACLQEVLGILLWEIDRWSDILDPDLCPAEYLDLMLYDLGNPFPFPLEEMDKRRLVQALVPIYRLKGTGVGIQNAINFFLGIQVTLDVYANGDTMVLGESELGVNWTLGAGTQALLYSFTVVVEQVLTSEQRERIRDIVNYMKPAHTHLVAIVEPTPPVILDHLELGESELGGDEWNLH